MGPPTVMMGASFAYLQCAAQTDLRFLGRRVGWLQTANIVGSMLGAVVTGLLALHGLGTTGTLIALVLLGVPFALAYERAVRDRAALRVAAAVTAVAFVATLVSIPSGSKLWARLHGSRKADVIASEDRSGLSVLVRRGPEVIVYANGIGQSSLPFGGFGGVHTILGALPAMVHPAPESVAVIGLGSGDTLFGVAGRPETRTIDSIEIVAPALETLRLLDERGSDDGRGGDPGLRRLLRDPRTRHHFTDGRAFLARSPQRYDVIEADALRPNSAYAGNLYSTEYFELLRDRLKPGGIAVSWAASTRVCDSFVKVFPYVVLVPHILMGSSSPIRFDPERIRERLRVPFTRDHYAAAGIDIAGMIAPYLVKQAEYGPDFDRSRLRDVNRDLFPKDEFLIPHVGS
jgi:spermidine synthase